MISSGVRRLQVLRAIRFRVIVIASVPDSCLLESKADGDCVAASSRGMPCAKKCAATEKTRKASLKLKAASIHFHRRVALHLRDPCGGSIELPLEYLARRSCHREGGQPSTSSDVLDRLDTICSRAFRRRCRDFRRAFTQHGFEGRQAILYKASHV